MSLANFRNWEESHRRELGEVFELLSEPLHDEPEVLIGQLSGIESWNSRIQYLLAEANSWLENMQKLELPSKDDRSEMERKILLASAVSEPKQIRDKIAALCDSIKTRITLGQSFLKYHVVNQSITMQPKSIKQILGE